MNEKPFAAKEAHEVEAFGPVSTIMPYTNMDEVIALSKLGKEVCVQLLLRQIIKKPVNMLSAPLRIMAGY